MKRQESTESPRAAMARMFINGLPMAALSVGILGFVFLAVAIYQSLVAFIIPSAVLCAGSGMTAFIAAKSKRSLEK